MKASEIYRKAAAMLENDEYSSPYACDNIGAASGWFLGPISERRRLLYIKLLDRFAALFTDEEGNERGVFFGPDTDENQNARVLALCLMAAIAEDEERA